MQPAMGGRFDVRLLEHDDRGARFLVELGTPDGKWAARAEVTAQEGNVSLSSWSGAGHPPEWLCQYLRAALRVAFRQHREEGWPRRLTRWRAPRSEPESSGE